MEDIKLRSFIDTYRKKKLPKMTVEEFIRNHNRELLITCKKCGNIEDIRITFFCPDCGAQLDEKYKTTKHINNDSGTH